MKQLRKFLFLLILALSSCTARDTQTNKFDASDDTLTIESRRIEGNGLFMIGASQLSFKDTVEWKEILDWFDLYFKFPDNLENPKIGLTSIMFNPLRYFDKRGHDTIQKNSSRQENTIGIVSGIIEISEMIQSDHSKNGFGCPMRI
jgi:hypothetical protein